MNSCLSAISAVMRLSGSMVSRHSKKSMNSARCVSPFETTGFGDFGRKHESSVGCHTYRKIETYNRYFACSKLAHKYLLLYYDLEASSPVFRATGASLDRPKACRGPLLGYGISKSCRDTRRMYLKRSPVPVDVSGSVYQGSGASDGDERRPLVNTLRTCKQYTAGV